MRTRLPIVLMACALAALLAACSQPSELPPTAGGLARGDSARLSLLVTQTRAQYPELTATALKQGSQRGASEGAQLAELALVGQGVSLRPGIQVGERETVKMSLFLDKSGYDAGHAALTIAGGAEEEWRVIGYDLRGDVTADFELLFALADPASRVRYLAVLGGIYEADGRRLLAYEGTLIVPGPGVRIEGWERIYKINFGFKHPAEPLYLAGVARANGQMAEIRRALATLESLTRRGDTGRAELESLRARSPAPDQTQRHEQSIAQREQQVAQTETERGRTAKEAEDTFLKYWATRASVDSDYADFQASNAYRWRDATQQQAWFDEWKQVEFHHPRIDELRKALGAFLPDQGAAIAEARAKAIATIDRLNNWSKNPSRSDTPAPR
jgi:hypothetical protein